MVDTFKKQLGSGVFLALAKGFGLQQNGMAFAQMALSVPWKAILQNAQKQETLEVLFMGQVGIFKKPLTHAYFQQQHST